MSVEINRFEFEKACKLYTASLNPKVSDTKKPPIGCPEQFEIKGLARYYWNNGKPYLINKTIGLDILIKGKSINEKPYYITQSIYEKKCATYKRGDNRNIAISYPSTQYVRNL
jgi:hypothetical protein